MDRSKAADRIEEDGEAFPGWRVRFLAKVDRRRIVAASPDTDGITNSPMDHRGGPYTDDPYQDIHEEQLDALLYLHAKLTRAVKSVGKAIDKIKSRQ